MDAGPPPQKRSTSLPLVAGVLVVAALSVVGVYVLLFGRTAAPGPDASTLPTPAAIATSTSQATNPPTPAPSTSKAPPPSVPDSTPSAVASAAPSTSAGPLGTDLPIDPTIEAGIREVISAVPGIRGLEALTQVPFRFISQRQFEQEFAAQFLAENPPERLVAEGRMLQRLGFLAPEQDLQQLVLTLYSSQVAAFYDPATGAFTVIVREGFDFGPDDRIIVAHEYAHALQDQHFDLEATQVSDAAEGDRALAELGLIEGDATALMFDWAIQTLSFEELLEIAGSALTQDQAILDSMPPVLQRQITFPYLDGCYFVNAVRGGSGYSAVDDAFGERPTSTEQILHPEKYAAGEPPVSVALLDVVAALGTGWTESYRQTMGELLIDVWVAEAPHTPSLDPCSIPSGSSTAAAGWGGDRLVSLDGPDGTWAVVWATAWDSGLDADEFNAAALAAVADLPAATYVRRAIIVDGVDQPVLVIVARDQATLDLVEQAVLNGL